MSARERFSLRKIGNGQGIWDKVRQEWCDGIYYERLLADNMLRHFNHVARLQDDPMCIGIPEGTIKEAIAQSRREA